MYRQEFLFHHEDMLMNLHMLPLLRTKKSNLFLIIWKTEKIFTIYTRISIYHIRSFDANILCGINLVIIVSFKIMNRPKIVLKIISVSFYCSSSYEKSTFSIVGIKRLYLSEIVFNEQRLFIKFSSKRLTWTVEFVPSKSL